MTCVSPPEPADHELLAYLDGEAGPEVEAHLKICPHCRERAEALTAIHARVAAHLYRVSCPDAHELGEYHLGLLPRNRAAAVRAHLASCPHCAREVAQLEGYLEDLAPQISVTPSQRVRRLVARLFEPEERPGPAGRLAPVPAYAIRGMEEGPRLYRVQGFQIALEVQEEVVAPGRYTLLGLVTGTGTETLEAHLSHEGLPVARAAVDELGNVVLATLAPGIYALVLRSAELEIRIPEIPVGVQPIDHAQEENP